MTHNTYQEIKQELSALPQPVSLESLQETINTILTEHRLHALELSFLQPPKSEQSKNLILIFSHALFLEDAEKIFSALKETLPPNLLGDPIYKGTISGEHFKYPKFLIPYLPSQTQTS